jgi:hypothetical protein
MTKLTDAQRAMLAKAAARDDGAVSARENAGKARAAGVPASTIAQKLLREAKENAGTPIWRKDATGRLVSLIITRAGRKVEHESFAKRDKGRSPKTRGALQQVERGDDSPSLSAPRAGTKQALVVGMLSKEQGVTLAALVDATGWLPHTMRAALTGLRKKGYAIERIRGERESSCAYRIVTADKAAA